MSVDQETIISEELESIKKRLPKDELVSCFRSLVRVQLQKTTHKKIIMHMQFPENYPSKPLLVELKSNTLAEGFLNKMEALVDEEMKKYVGQTQIMYAYKFVRGILDSNPFVVCWEEIKKLKVSFESPDLIKDGTSASVKLFEKTSTIKLKFVSGKYVMSLALEVPNEYPVKAVKLSVEKCNFPKSFVKVFVGHAEEIARVSTVPPLRPPRKDFVFVARPCIFEIADFLFRHSVVRYCGEKCPICEKQCFPDNPEDYDEKALVDSKSYDKLIERVYCGHIYHHSCLDTYMNTPPFRKEGKLCLRCKLRIFHPKWTPDIKLAEARWAHKQAREREVKEVAEFMGIEEYLKTKI